MEPEGWEVLARDLAHLDTAQYWMVAQWMIDHGWTEPLDPVPAIYDGLMGCGCRYGVHGESAASMMAYHRARCGCGHGSHPGLICGYPVPTPGNQPPVPRYCECEG